MKNLDKNDYISKEKLLFGRKKLKSRWDYKSVQNTCIVSELQYLISVVNLSDYRRDLSDYRADPHEPISFFSPFFIQL